MNWWQLGHTLFYSLPAPAMYGLSCSQDCVYTWRWLPCQLRWEHCFHAQEHCFLKSWPPSSSSVNYNGSCARGHEYYIRACPCFQTSISKPWFPWQHTDLTHLRDAAPSRNILMLSSILFTRPTQYFLFFQSSNFFRKKNQQLCQNMLLSITHTKVLKLDRQSML